ncbi:cytochrome P450 [Gordonia sp. NB41Y]|uniref:cytochrome P450 n=1 Tax=Gordonia sp. NB41Y TaxID=875808 RepID=UPI0006B21CBD|nr:cytochrome P450 [Gordonia sp. NB41Y]EMP12196.2 cytochrome P450 [Gordonia sp. NB41Y]WLP92249.1 cytochrome P450 [Gordonia sp. NB41Y]
MDTDRQTPRFGLRSGSGWADPFGMYARLRRESPVHHVSPGPTPADDYWVLTRYADVADAATDPATFSSAAGLTVTYGELEAIGMVDNPPLVMQDPPVHTAFRSLVARGFTPRQVTSLEPQVHEFVADRLDRLAEAARGTDGPIDVVGELLKPLPSMIVAHYLGVPEADRTHFDEWTSAIVGAVGPTATTDSTETDAEAVRATAGAATGELLAYFADLIARRRIEPGDDTVSALVAAGRADDDAGLVSILAFVFTMIAGGNDTTTGLLGGSLELLAAAPDQRARLVAEPDLIPDALEELLRLTSPVQGLARTTTRPVAYPDVGVEIPAGVKVLLCYGAANRDPEVFGPDADFLDITRRPRRILTFGRGDHHCLGAAAARMAGRIALTELLARFPDFDVDPDGIIWAAGNYVRRPVYVPFRP